MSRQDHPLRVRVPAALLDRLQSEAAANGRSMNAEIVFQLTYAGNAPMASAESSKPESISIRLTAECKAKLDAACQAGPYRLSKTSIIERGIDLAVEEIRRMNGKSE